MSRSVSVLFKFISSRCETDEDVELVWSAIAGLLNSIRSVWFENESVLEGLACFQRVSPPLLSSDSGD
jgi:hypothetical protein